MTPFPGVIRVSEPLDRETVSRYTLTVRATDAGLKSTNATVALFVTDVNDSPPYFVDGPYSFRVKEGARGATVGKVEARDDDAGRASEISYSVEKGENYYFKCNGVSV